MTMHVTVSQFSLELCFLFLMSDWVSLPLSCSLSRQYLQATIAQQCPCSVPSPWGFSLGCTMPTTCSDQKTNSTGHLCLFSPTSPLDTTLFLVMKLNFQTTNFFCYLSLFPALFIKILGEIYNTDKNLPASNNVHTI